VSAVASLWDDINIANTEVNMKIYQVDAFADRVFGGNPAAVVPLESWIDDAILQSIAQENNLAETAFIVPKGQDWELRWFTPNSEVALCGHATLGSAHVIFKHLGFAGKVVHFHTRYSGILSVEKMGSDLLMSFPAVEVKPSDNKEKVESALGCTISDLQIGYYSEDESDYVAVVDSEQELAAVEPDMRKTAALDGRGVIVTAKGDTHDFVSRYFAPSFGVDEDPVTGSAHCLLAPYWAGRLGKTHLSARQISARGGDVGCEVKGDRVILKGKAVDYLVGEISV